MSTCTSNLYFPVSIWWTEKPGALQFMGLQRIKTQLSNWTAPATIHLPPTLGSYFILIDSRLNNLFPGPPDLLFCKPNIQPIFYFPLPCPQKLGFINYPCSPLFSLFCFINPLPKTDYIYKDACFPFMLKTRCYEFLKLLALSFYSYPIFEKEDYKQGIDFWNIQTAHTAQYQKNKQPNWKVSRRPK